MKCLQQTNTFSIKRLQQINTTMYWYVTSAANKYYWQKNVCSKQILLV